MGKPDPWSIAPVETVDIDGISVEVRGLMVGEIDEIVSANKDDNKELTKALISACCSRADGVAITPKMLGDIRPDVMRVLDEAVSRVNGFQKGNSNATGDEDSSSV